MNIIIYIFICTITIGSNTPYNVKGKGFKGYIFAQDHFALVSIDNQSKRYTPSKEEVVKAECLLKRKLKILNQDLVNQQGDCPVIHKRLKKYVRQYLGFENVAGEKVIWINFLWKDKNILSQLSKDLISVQDGCSHYWTIEVNLTREVLVNLEINGPA